jgi:hypothetical protein
MGLAGIRIKPDNFKYVVVISAGVLLVARYFHHSFDTITLCAGVAASAITIYVLRDEKIAPGARYEELKGEQLSVI